VWHRRPQRDAELWNRLTEHDVASLTTWGVWAAVVGASVVILFRNQLFKALDGRSDMVGDRNSSAARLYVSVRPARGQRPRDGRSGAGLGGAERQCAEIARGRGGDFSVRAQVNGARVSMVLDSGASSVVLTQEAAKAVGLPLEVLQYTANVDTANGRTRAAPVTLDRLRLAASSSDRFRH
jgi:aspartyl protease family protein